MTLQTKPQILPPVATATNWTGDVPEGEFRWEYYVENRPLNIAYEAVTRHVEEGYGKKVALYEVEGGQVRSYTFQEIDNLVRHYANVLRALDVRRGERVAIFLPKCATNYIALLAAIRIGAIAVPLFEAFMEEAIVDRVLDSGATTFITDETLGQRVPLQRLPSIRHFLYTSTIEQFTPKEEASIVYQDKEAPFLLHYTSGSTGKPKGVLHAQRAFYHQRLTGRWVLDLRDDDIYWCTSHPGWVTGSVYGFLAPWFNRATVVVHCGRFDASEWYSVIEKLKVTVLYSAPTAYRLLIASDAHKQYDLSSVRHAMSVGEPLNPEVIHWFEQTLKIRLHDTWWMTETGAHLIVNAPHAPVKPGSMGRAFPGITVGILNDTGELLPSYEVGHLAIQAPWPGLMKTIWNNEERFNQYFNEEGWYHSGDLAYMDEDGYVFFASRDDDLIMSAGERIGPFEVESTLLEHEAVKEAGVVGVPDEVKGEVVKAYVTLHDHVEPSSLLEEQLIQHVRTHLAAHAAPRYVEFIEELPKTVISGKIMRRELKKRHRV